jgi:hypothetical protein
VKAARPARLRLCECGGAAAMDRTRLCRPEVSVDGPCRSRGSSLRRVPSPVCGSLVTVVVTRCKLLRLSVAPQLDEAWRRYRMRVADIREVRAPKPVLGVPVTELPE